MFLFKKSKSSARKGIPKAFVSEIKVEKDGTFVVNTEKTEEAPVKKTQSKKTKAEKKPVAESPVEIIKENEISDEDGQQ